MSDLFTVGLADRLKLLVDEFSYDAVGLELRRLAPTVVAGSAPARPTDPETSHWSAKEEDDVGRFSAKSRKAKLLWLFERGDYTDQEAAVLVMGTAATPSTLDGCRRRVSELRLVSFIVPSGSYRKNPGSSDVSIVSTLGEAGKVALQGLMRNGWSR